MKKNYIYYAIGAAILLYLFRNKDKSKKEINETIKNDLVESLPNSLDIVLIPDSGAIQVVPSPATIMPYIKTMQVSNDLNALPCENCGNSLSGMKTMPYTC
jgi:hypothetical protein